MSQTAAPITWLGRIPITAKLALVSVSFLVMTSLLVGVVSFTLQLSSGIRAYVGGEGLWSKGQKDALHYLNRYVHSHDERDYEQYLAAISIPLGDHQARIEMMKPVFDYAVAEDGFRKGGNDPDDIGNMIFLFRHFGDMPFIKSAISVWAAADEEIAKLQAVALAVRAAVQQGPLDIYQRVVFLDQLDVINAHVTPLEIQFSETLAEGARAIHELLQSLIWASAILLLSLSMLVAWLVASDLRASVRALREGTQRVAQGDLEHPIPLRSRDELGDLARAFNDMTARRRDAEQQLHNAQDLREKVMLSATNSIYAMDPEGRFTLVNPSTCELTGYSEEELIGRNFASLFTPEHLAPLVVRYRDVIEGKGPILDYEVPLLRKDGVMRHIVFSTAALSRDGVIIGAAGAAEDITERKRSEEEVRQRTQELTRSNEELEQFAYVASHDLQEPLRTVSGFAQLLAKRYQGKLDAEADEYIEFISTGVVRMKSLIEDLLTYSRVSRGRFREDTLDLNLALQNALSNLRAAVDSTQAVITAASLPTLRGDQRQMEQLFQNLIGNAIKFRGDATPLIKISVERKGADWHFTLCDNGIGINPDSCERIFGLFQRLHTRDAYPGNGIGLTICKKIVELHRGRIWAESTSPGTCFHFTLPAA